jgi:hypothetical protein
MNASETPPPGTDLSSDIEQVRGVGMNDELLNVAAGVLLGISALAIKQAIFPDVSGLVPGVAFVIGAYALSTQTDEGL